MTGRRITLKIDRVTLSSAEFSRRELAAAIEKELGQALHPSAGALADPGNLSIQRLQTGRIKGRATAAGVGQVVARATLGAMRR